MSKVTTLKRCCDAVMLYCTVHATCKCSILHHLSATDSTAAAAAATVLYKLYE
jgi:hypothetical protein